MPMDETFLPPNVAGREGRRSSVDPVDPQFAPMPLQPNLDVEQVPISTVSVAPEHKLLLVHQNPKSS